jgi:hypothetical protein
LAKFSFLVYIQPFFPFWGKRLPIPIWKKIGKKPWYEGYSRKISTKFQKGKKILHCHFLMINKFWLVIKHIEFFFGNFHIWYIATHGWFGLWLNHKIGNENTVNLVSLVNSMHSPYFNYF